jgi:hypothetical protein
MYFLPSRVGAFLAQHTTKAELQHVATKDSSKKPQCADQPERSPQNISKVARFPRKGTSKTPYERTQKTEVRDVLLLNCEWEAHKNFFGKNPAQEIRWLGMTNPSGTGIALVEKKSNGEFKKDSWSKR